MTGRQALVEPDTFNQARYRTHKIVYGCPFAQGHAEMVEGLLEYGLKAFQPLRLLFKARLADPFAPQAIGHDAEPQRPQKRIVHSWRGAALRSSCRLAGKERIYPGVRRWEGGRIGVLNVFNPVTGTESVPSGETTRRRPGFSVTSALPSGRNAMPHGNSRPVATVTTSNATFESLIGARVCPGNAGV